MSLKQEFSLRQHQQHGADATLKRSGNIIFSHPTGSGKTLTSIAAFEGLKKENKANRALVVTPASLRENYGENGVKKFTNSKYVVYGNKQETNSDTSGKYAEPSDRNPEYGIISYEMFRQDPKKYIEGHGADTVIFDELHRIKNDTSLTYKALKDNRGLFKNFIGMTGSITSNTPADVVPLIDAMTNGNHRLGSKASFENRFVTTDKDGNKVVSNSILARSLIAPYVHNVTDEQLEGNTGLRRPDKQINEITLPLTGEHEELYRYAIDQLDPLTKAKLALGLGKLSKTELDAVFAKLVKARQVANSTHTLDRKISLEDAADNSVKVKRLLDDVEDHIKKTPDAQVVIHSQLVHGGIDVLEAGLKKRNIEFGKFIGKGNAGVTEKSRQKDVDDYNLGKKRVILISSAGGEGLDLPNTTMVAGLDGHWNPEKINQVEARGVRMGGLSHREEKDRKVIINRYLTKLPVSKIDAFKSAKRLIDPFEIADRVLSGEPVIYNPYKSTPTVDQLMYSVAKQKARGNAQMKDLFDKTAAYSIQSDKAILQEYLDRFQDKLLTGDYRGEWIDKEQENRYINKLRNYYSLATNPGVIAIKPKDLEKYQQRTPTTNALKHFGTGAVTGALITPLAGLGPIITMYNHDGAGKAALLAGVAAGLGAAVMGTASAIHNNKPHVTTPSSGAKSKIRLTDEELRDMLRGEAIRKEKTKDVNYVISFK
jgi:superfamily II DNA/RNA helicase